MDKGTSSVPVKIENAILLIRGQKVMLDSDLANLYQVPTRVLIQAMKRNQNRFPIDFVFQLTKEELESLRSQIVISKGKGGRRYLPYVFTEHGAVMLASVLNSDRAIEASVYVVRAFVRLRELLGTQKAFAQKLTELERRVVGHDQDIREIVVALRQLMAHPHPPKRQIGFQGKR
jgi:hypothetical protein